MNIDISYSGFIDDLFLMVEFTLQFILEFATNVIDVVSMPITEALEHLIDVSPSVILDLPLQMLTVFLELFVEDSSEISVLTFVFSSWVFLFIIIKLIGFFRQLFASFA